MSNLHPSRPRLYLLPPMETAEEPTADQSPVEAAPESVTAISDGEALLHGILSGINYGLSNKSEIMARRFSDDPEKEADFIEDMEAAAIGCFSRVLADYDLPLIGHAINAAAQQSSREDQTD